LRRCGIELPAARSDFVGVLRRIRHKKPQR
jgi:hypothetical protein